MENPKIELKAGLEVHQQLESHKLFCNCPSILRNEEPDFIIKRRLHTVAGEKGLVDEAAKHEKLKDREFIYQAYRDTTCLLEYDECPPYPINQEALKIVCQVALLLNCEIIQNTQVMRKTVIDGSNTSGFQRTVMIAKDGFIETSFGRVRIQTVLLEEDAARKISEDEHSITYRLDRLGLPLIEIATYPDLHYPEQVKEAALKIGEILRACKVKRGIGTIRQDINISIPGGERVEIKGFQDPSIMIKTVELEKQRQKTLIEIYQQIQEKNLKEIKAKIIDLSFLFAKTNCGLIKTALSKNQRVLGAKISGFKGLLGKPLCEGKRFGSEVSDYAKVFGVGGIIHSDENLKEKYGLSEEEITSLVKELGVNEKKDAFILVASDHSKAEKALEAAVKRINLELKNAVLKEVRKTNLDGTTSYMRPMPGADRMYPETDLPLLHISRDLINEVKNSLPKLKTELKSELVRKGLSQEMINLVLDNGMLKEFEVLLKIYDNPNFVAKLLLVLPKEIASHEKLSEEKMQEIFSFEVFEDILREIANKKIREEDVKHILESLAKGKQIKEALRVEKADISEIEGEIAKIVKEKPGLNANAYMGLVMAKFKGKISGKDVADILSKLVK